MSALRLSALLLVGTASCATPGHENYAYGPAPDWQRYQELGSAAVRAALPEPDAWQIEWPMGYGRFGWNHNGRASGWVTCGVARAIRPVPKYQTRTRFAIVIDQNMVKKVDISPRDNNSFVNVICDALIANGTIPPASAMAASSETTSAHGMSFRTMPEGAYVTAVTPGSPADRAGVTVGTVVTNINGIALAGMGAAMGKVIASEADGLTLSTVAGQTLTVRPRQ